MLDKYDYQTEVLQRAANKFREGHRRVCLVLPTGGGKTRVARRAVNQHVADTQKRCVWLTHRAELIDQAYRELRGGELKFPVGIVSAAHVQPDAKAPVQVVSIQTLAARPELELDPTFFVVDECHTVAVAAEWNAVIVRYPNVPILGLTATPSRSDGVGLGSAFDTMVIGPSIRELTARGVLVPLRIFGADKLLPPRRVWQEPVEAWRDCADGSRTLLFAPNVLAAKTYAERFSRAGIPAEALDALTPAPVRRDLIERFRAGDIRVLCNVQILTTGTDIPDVGCIMLARGVGHLGLLMQMVGRGLRSAPGKTECTLVDLCGSIHVLGRPDEDIVFSLDGRGMRSATLVESTVAYCLVCGQPVDKEQSVCAVCGYQRPELDVPRSLGKKLIRWESVAKIPDPRRVQMLTRWLVEAKMKGWKPNAPLARYKGMFGQWPAQDVLAQAKVLARKRTG